MKRTSLTERDASRPSDRVHPRPRKAARTNEPEPSTNNSDTEEATAPLANTPMTPMASHDMQDVMRVVNDILKERDEMKSSLEAFQDGIRLEMANIQKRLGELELCQARQEAAIKALTEAKTSQHQAPENLEKEVATAAKAIETVSEQIRGIDDQITPAVHSQADDEAVTSRASGSLLPSTEENRSGVMWKGTKLYILNAPKDWEPPQNCPEPPEKNELWLSRRGSKISRHPLADSVPQLGESAIERATRYHGDGKDGL